MILGILSDTHGKADMAMAAVKLLAGEGAEQLIHCGDVGTEAVLDALAGMPSVFVFGNNDWDRAGLQRYAESIGIVCGGDQKKLEFDGKFAVVTHGDDERIVQRVLKNQLADYLFLGHSHVPMDVKEGRVRIINPGALYRASEKTVAVLDTKTDLLKFLTVSL